MRQSIVHIAPVVRDYDEALDYHCMAAKGIKFIREPKQAENGMVAVFEDLCGNLWDLLQLNENHPIVKRL